MGGMGGSPQTFHILLFYIETLGDMYMCVCVCNISEHPADSFKGLPDAYVTVKYKSPNTRATLEGLGFSVDVGCCMFPVIMIGACVRACFIFLCLCVCVCMHRRLNPQP